MRSYIGITSHIVVDFVLESQMVACKCFRGSRTAENMHEMFEETIAPYDLTQKTLAIVTDNAANMVKEFSLTGMEILDEADSDDDDPEGNDIIQPIAIRRGMILYNPSSQIPLTKCPMNKSDVSQGVILVDEA